MQFLDLKFFLIEKYNQRRLKSCKAKKNLKNK